MTIWGISRADHNITAAPLDKSHELIFPSPHFLSEMQTDINIESNSAGLVNLAPVATQFPHIYLKNVALFIRLATPAPIFANDSNFRLGRHHDFKYFKF